MLSNVCPCMFNLVCHQQANPKHQSMLRLYILKTLLKSFVSWCIPSPRLYSTNSNFSNFICPLLFALSFTNLGLYPYRTQPPALRGYWVMDMHFTIIFIRRIPSCVVGVRNKGDAKHQDRKLLIFFLTRCKHTVLTDACWRHFVASTLCSNRRAPAFGEDGLFSGVGAALLLGPDI